LRRERESESPIERPLFPMLDDIADPNAGELGECP
jgi:hypothetical protein